MKRVYLFIIFFLLIGCSEPTAIDFTTVSEKDIQLNYKKVPERQINLDKFNQTPKEWGEHVSGVKRRFVTEKKEIALTFDACGGPYGNGYDEELIDFLQAEQIPATLFVNERWILENKETFLSIANNPLFQIENHGTAHSPLSVNGGEAWGIPATTSVEEAYEEIMQNHKTVYELTGRNMNLFRSGTAFYDEIAVQLAGKLGYEVVNFDVLGDAGATFTRAQVEQALMSASTGSIVLLHMNQPTSDTAEGVKAAVPRLREANFEFVLLEGKELE